MGKRSRTPPPPAGRRPDRRPRPPHLHLPLASALRLQQRTPRRTRGCETGAQAGVSVHPCGASIPTTANWSTTRDTVDDNSHVGLLRGRQELGPPPHGSCGRRRTPACPRRPASAGSCLEAGLCLSFRRDHPFHTGCFPPAEMTKVYFGLAIGSIGGWGWVPVSPGGVSIPSAQSDRAGRGSRNPEEPEFSFTAETARKL